MLTNENVERPNPRLIGNDDAVALFGQQGVTSRKL
jgi:hypothetical protein